MPADRRPPVDDEHGPQDWNTYRRLVLNELERLNENQKEVINRLTDLDRSVLMLQAKASMWGAVAGIMSSIIVSVIAALIARALGASP